MKSINKSMIFIITLFLVSTNLHIHAAKLPTDQEFFNQLNDPNLPVFKRIGMNEQEVNNLKNLNTNFKKIQEFLLERLRRFQGDYQESPLYKQIRNLFNKILIEIFEKKSIKELLIYLKTTIDLVETNDPSILPKETPLHEELPKEQTEEEDEKVELTLQNLEETEQALNLAILEEEIKAFNILSTSMAQESKLNTDQNPKTVLIPKITQTFSPNAKSKSTPKLQPKLQPTIDSKTVERAAKIARTLVLADRSRKN